MKSWQKGGKMKLCRIIYDKRYRESMKGKIAQRRHRKTEKGKITHRKAVHNYRQTEKGKVAHCKESTRYHTRHPEQRKAGHTIMTAIRANRLTHPDTLSCYYCPAQAKEYHHNKGYAKKHWLDVVPVCQRCHTKVDKKAG